ncbi:MAG: CRISPR-associated endonuclease Cas1 [Chloroflexota bacterium]|nr:CRISPR-associated endonuclease Cas1 [Chloroflexota bacterium]
MLTQRTSGVSWPEEVILSNGIFVASGYGIRIFVWRGRLRVDDGIGANRRSRLFHRATSGLRRLVVLGHTGYVSLEALRWLADLKAGFLQIDADGRVVAAFGPPGTDRPSLRRAQAVASQNGRALVLSRWLVDLKVAAQAETLSAFPNLPHADEAIAIIAAYREAIADAGSVDELRSSEAFAAGAYWQVLGPLQVRFAKRDAERVPSHWRTFGGRGSPIGNGPRLAGNPANAVLNYLYALLEAEATLAARIIGLDPGLGVMHVDQAHRDSLSADLMEPIRPIVDAYAFELLASRPFAARDYHETRAGVCRVTPPLTHELAETLPRWRELVGRVAEDFATALEIGHVPTPITGRRRAEGRPNGPRSRSTKATSDRRCGWCGGKPLPGRATCSDDCAHRILAHRHEAFALASSERMRRLAQQVGGHPALTAKANEGRRTTRRAQRAAELEWEDSHPEPVDTNHYAVAILPNLRQLSAQAIARATGLSVSYCSEIKRGQRTPHPRWWETLGNLQ